MDPVASIKRWTPGEFAAMIGVSTRTLKRWHDSGKLVAGTYPSGRRFYTDGHLKACAGPDQPIVKGGAADGP